MSAARCICLATGRGCALLATLLLLLGGFAVVAQDAAAQRLRYSLITDVRETYDTYAYANPSASTTWDVVTELEPGFRMYCALHRGLFAANYRFLLQLFPNGFRLGEGRQTYGFANTADLSLGQHLSLHTDLGITNRFFQGTQSVTSAGQINQAGGYEIGRLNLTTAYIADSLSLQISHALAPRWSIAPHVHGEVYHPTNRPDGLPEGGGVPSPDTYSVGLSVPVRYALPSGSLSLAPEGRALFEVRPIRPVEVPSLLSTYLVGAVADWLWTITPFLQSTVRGGFTYQFLERYRTDAGTTTQYFDSSLAPTGGLSLRYVRGQTLSLSLEYQHGYQTRTEVAAFTTSQSDSLGLSGYWIHNDFAFDVGTGFSYMRTTSRLADQEQTGATKVGRGEAQISYRLRPGVSLHSGYQIDLIVDQAPSVGIDGRPLPLPPNIIRQRFTLGLSLAFPPPPPQDVRLNRRESEYQPTFEAEESSGGGDTGAGE